MTRSRIVRVFLIILAAGLMSACDQAANTKVPEDFLDRSGMVLFQNNRSDSGDNPFILEAKIISETPSKIAVALKYFMSDTIKGEYNISVHPDTSDWSYNPTTMRSGINEQTMIVSFSPQPPTKEESRSTVLHIYVNHYERPEGQSGQYIGKVFDRTVPFPKTWTH